VYATTGARILVDIQTSTGDQMGDVIRVPSHQPVEFSLAVTGTAPLERVELRNGMRVLKTLRTYSKDDLANRIKLLWQGAEVRGRGRQVEWNGRMRLNRARLKSWETINFWNCEQPCERLGPHELTWSSLTTGGTAGVILELDRLTGDLDVETTQRSFRTSISALGVTGRTYRAGGIGKRISAYRLPPAGGSRHLQTTIRIQPRQLHTGDNPLYVCVIQEDGHMAWSSPIYVAA
jgi:hypothetical protein